MHVVADVALVGKEGCPRMEADAHADWPVHGKSFGELRRSRDSAGRSRERKEEGISLRVHLDSALGETRLPDDPPVLRECLGVAVRPELV